MASSDFIVQGGAELRNPARARVALEASWEIDGLVTALIARIAAGIDVGDDLFIRGLSMRIRDLNTATMRALGDEGQDVSDLREMVTGVRPIKAELTD